MSEEAPKSSVTHSYISFAIGTYTVWANTYDSKLYSPELTDNRATTEEINTVLKSIQTVRKPSVIKNCLGSPLWLVLFLLGPVVMVYFLPTDDFKNPGLQIALDIIVTIIYMALVYWFAIKGHDIIEENSRVLIRQLLTNINPDFLSRGT